MRKFSVRFYKTERSGNILVNLGHSKALFRFRRLPYLMDEELFRLRDPYKVSDSSRAVSSPEDGLCKRRSFQDKCPHRSSCTVMPIVTAFVLIWKERD